MSEFEMKRVDTRNIHFSFYETHVRNMYNPDEFADRVKQLDDQQPNQYLRGGNPGLASRVLNKEKLQGLELYKIIDIKNLQYILADNKLYVDKVSSWEDPYENFFLKANHQSPKYDFSAEHWSPYIFGQSWSLKPESDAMWRIYSRPGKDNEFVKSKNGWKENMRCFTGVRLKTAADRLLDACYVDDSSMALLWMGKVLYADEQQIWSHLQQVIKDSSNYNDIFGQSYFYKRKEFDHEEEFRMVYSFSTEYRNEPQKCADRISFPINVPNFIDEFMLDPRIDSDSEEFLKKLLINMGVDQSKIVKSDLYSFKGMKFQWPK